jgi:hypothetical protein
MATIQEKEKAILAAAFAKSDPVAFAIALGSVLGLTLFLATAVLLIKSTFAGTEPGPHLALIGIYLPGFEVSWPGAALGAVYLAAIGAVTGFVLGALWNLTHYLYAVVKVVRESWLRLMAD